MTVSATDSGGRKDHATVYINVTDANNNAPIFENTPYAVSVFEDAPVGATILVVLATDNDVGVNAQVTYSLDEETDFAINSQTGALTTIRPLDREIQSSYLLTVTAKDGGNPPLQDTTDIEISVGDINDNAPTFLQPSYSAAIPEDALVGTSVVQVCLTKIIFLQSFYKNKFL